MSAPNRAEHPNRKIGSYDKPMHSQVDTARGYGTHDQLPGLGRTHIPGVSSTSREIRETAERRTSQTIPGFGKQTAFKDINTPGTGQR